MFSGPGRDKVNMYVMLFTSACHTSLQGLSAVQKMWMKAALPRSFPTSETFSLNVIVKQTGCLHGKMI